ncbi:MAG: polysaccharide deacetylase family protein [Acidobacteriaceae bacterium]|nr:polysaccharide deacetylase family protein [Acidobacteriaceae bacterium]
MLTNAVSVDVEDWYHPELVRHSVAAEDREQRLLVATEPLLEILAFRQVSCTFFILGELAQRYPDLVRRLHSGGHEIACHGMTHIPLWQLTPEEFRQELRDFLEIIRMIDPSIRVKGFRAPTFSVDARTAWALQVLAEEGFKYDSSIFPFANRVYGVPGAPLTPYRPDLEDLRRHSDSGPMWEFPLSVVELASLRVPVSGGFYLRLWPYAFTAWALRRVNRDRPFVLYCHPWECDPGLPRRKLGLVNGFITYTGVRGARAKLDRLLSDFPCSRIDSVLENYGRYQTLFRAQSCGL